MDFILSVLWPCNYPIARDNWESDCWNPLIMIVDEKWFVMQVIHWLEQKVRQTSTFLANQQDISTTGGADSSGFVRAVARGSSGVRYTTPKPHIHPASIWNQTHIFIVFRRSVNTVCVSCCNGAANQPFGVLQLRNHFWQTDANEYKICWQTYASEYKIWLCKISLARRNRPPCTHCNWCRSICQQNARLNWSSVSQDQVRWPAP